MTNGQKGEVPARYQSLATYLAKYVVSPPISLRRIDRDDGHQVTYHYRSHKSEQVERETVEVYPLIGRMIQHVFPKGFQRIRYYGGTRSGCQNIKLAIASYDGVPCRNGHTSSLTLRHLGTDTPRSTGLYSGS